MTRQNKASNLRYFGYSFGLVLTLSLAWQRLIFLTVDSELPVIDPLGGVVISWDPVTMSHSAKHGVDGLGVDGVIEVRYYEVVVEIDETDFKSVAILPPDVNEWTLAEEFF